MRNLEININKLSFFAKKQSKYFAKKSKFIVDEKRRSCYHKFMLLNQTEFATIIYNESHKLFVIKKRYIKDDH